MPNHELAGVYVAAITPLRNDYSPDIEAIPELLRFYAERGNHGALLLGTTGEGPSFSPSERVAIYEAATAIKASHPDFRLLAGTGTPSLSESIDLTKAAFELGFNGVVVLPPYYFRNASEGGLLQWFQQLINSAVPKDRFLLYYHIPDVSGVPVNLEFLINSIPGIIIFSTIYSHFLLYFQADNNLLLVQYTHDLIEQY